MRDRTGSADADSYLSNMVDLGRPPVVGLVEPDRELGRIADVRARLAAASPQPV